MAAGGGSSFVPRSASSGSSPYVKASCPLGDEMIALAPTADFALVRAAPTLHVARKADTRLANVVPDD